MAERNSLIFYLNGRKVELFSIEPETTLLQYLRETAGLTGSKLGCGEGGCGACTVMVSHYSPPSDSIIHRALNACLTPLAAMDGMAVTTVEGLGNTRQGLDPVQEKIANSHGSQCGFCTPGIVMSLYAYLRSHPGATKEDIEDCLDGNLCRCTGYRPILDAAKSFASDSSVSYTAAELVQQGANPPVASQGICPSTGEPCDCDKQAKSNQSLCFDPNKLTTHLIFPPFLKKYTPTSKVFKGERVTWYQPITLDELLSIKALHNEAKLVVGNTEVGIDRKFRHMKFPVVITPTRVPELAKFCVTDEGLEIGAAVTLTNLKNHLEEAMKNLPAYKTRCCSALLKQLRWFAGNQIRNAACIGGNICTASPISDINPVLIAANATLRMRSSNSSRDISVRDFFLKYRTTNLKPEEILVSIFVPFTRENEYFHAYKQARRRDDDIAIVTAGIRVNLEQKENNWIISEIYFGYGGMAPKTVFCPEAEAGLVGKPWDSSLIPIANVLLEKDLPLPPNAPGGMIQYRRTLTTSFFYKFFLFVYEKLYPGKLSPQELSAIPDFHKEISHGQQNYQSNQEVYPVSYPVVHAAAKKQVTGEAQYTDDFSTAGYHAAFVCSKKANAKILRIDPSIALESRGVIDFISVMDITGKNEIGPVILPDEPLFCSDHVYAMGQPIGLIVALTHEDACEAALLVDVEYEEYDPIITIEDAIAKNSFQGDELAIIDGDVDAKLKECDYVLEGQSQSGAQEHFYLEPNTTLATPGEGNEMRIMCSSQNATKTQTIVAHVLGVRKSDVVVTVKRMGGGFGGKETRSIFVSCAAAVAAYKLRKPVKLTLDRDVDMTISGLRHPFLGKYKVGFNKDGKIQALDLKLYSNAGYSLDLSPQVMERALLHVTNCYKVPTVRAIGKLCKTNITTNTAFRGFGGPQSMFICENWINQVAHTLNKDVNEIRKLNFFQPEDKTHYKQHPSDNHIHRLYEELLQSSEYYARLEEINEFNKNNRWKKRGIATLPTMFGMSFTVNFLNQAGALVHVYQDGSALISHAGAEMGQGIHTKIIQIAAKALQIPIEYINIQETCTDKVANTSPTAASVQSDINGMAVLNACEEIMKRLEPIRKENPDLTWAQLVTKAYLNRVDLSAHGHYATPDIGYNIKTNVGQPFNYFVWGASCSEVEIDVLTGDHFVRRADILMDLGESLNPAIDIGQIEGGFVQGMGWCTLEEIVWFDNGFQFTRGPGNYKIPSFNDVPVDFRVSLLKDSKNQRAIFSSKGVGEPPFFLAASVYFAIKHACSSARQDAGLEPEFWRLDSPATAEKIRNACVDQFTKQFE